jgi:amino acid permease
MEFDDFDLSPDDLMEGLPARRASTLLFAIESRTAQLVAREHQETAVYLTEAAARQPEQLFLDALAAGREAEIQPSIQEIERFAPQWAPLFSPEDSSGRAAVAHLLGQKYRFTATEVPQIQVALDLAATTVEDAYERFYKQPLETIYAPELVFQERLRWAWTGFAKRLETLPPFWSAFFLTIPAATGLLALPVVLAPLGVGLGMAVLVGFGLLNLLTVMALAESVARSGTTRLGMGFLGQLVDEYLGGVGSLLLSGMFAVNNFLVLIIFFMGLGGTLESSTGLPAQLWIGVVLLVCLYFLSKRSLNATIASTLIIVFVNVALLFIIPLLTIPYFDPGNLVMTPEQGTFTLAIVGPILGVMLSTYLSHFLVATYCPVVLRRDPTARTWIKGCAAALLFFIGVAALWLIVPSGVVPNEVLAGTTDTVLVPLAAAAGPAVTLLGAVLVSLSLGLASIQVALAQYYSIQERLPAAGTAGFWGRLGDRGRFWLAVTPMFLIFVLAEWVTVTGIGSFGRMLGFLGALALPLLSGMFPILLLASTRCKGDFVPGYVNRLLGNKVLLAAAYLFFLGSVFFFGLFIWQTTVERVITLVAGVAILIVTVQMLRQGALDRRLVVQIVDDQTIGGKPSFLLTDAGESAVADIAVTYPGYERTVRAASGTIPDFRALRRLAFQLAPTSSMLFKLWAYRLTPVYAVLPLPAHFNLYDATQEVIQTGELADDSGQAVLSLESKVPASLLVETKFESGI